MVNTFVIEYWQNIEGDNNKDHKHSSEDSKYNLKVYKGFLPVESKRTKRKLINAFGGKNIEEIVISCKRENIGLKTGEGLKDYITTSSCPVIQGDMLLEGVDREDLREFRKYMLS